MANERMERGQRLSHRSLE